MENKKNCEHNQDPIEKTIYIKGIGRIAMICPICRAILDYYPQYNED